MFKAEADAYRGEGGLGSRRAVHHQRRRQTPTHRHHSGTAKDPTNGYHYIDTTIVLIATQYRTVPYPTVPPKLLRRLQSSRQEASLVELDRVLLLERATSAPSVER